MPSGSFLEAYRPVLLELFVVALPLVDDGFVGVPGLASILPGVDSPAAPVRFESASVPFVDEPAVVARGSALERDVPGVPTSALEVDDGEVPFIVLWVSVEAAPDVSDDGEPCIAPWRCMWPAPSAEACDCMQSRIIRTCSWIFGTSALSFASIRTTAPFFVFSTFTFARDMTPE